jgi:hypothetical protein
MRREEQSGRDAGHQNAFGPQSGLEVGVSEVAPPVPSPTSGCGGEVPGSGGAVHGVWETKSPFQGKVRVRALPSLLTGSVSDCLAVQEV